MRALKKLSFKSLENLTELDENQKRSIVGGGYNGSIQINGGYIENSKNKLQRMVKITLQAWHPIFLGNVLFLLLFLFWGCIHNKKDIFVSLINNNSEVRCKFWYPDSSVENDKLVIWVHAPLNNQFSPDSINNLSNLDIYVLQRNDLLKKGVVNVEFIGRNDSIMIGNNKFCARDTNTEAQDLETVINYISSRGDLKKKQIILAGQSEGGDICAIIASKLQRKIKGLVLLSTTGIGGMETIEYQRPYQIKNSNALVFYIASSSKYNLFNQISSLDSHHEPTEEGFYQFLEEIVNPLEKKIFLSENIDTISKLMLDYLENRWIMEDDETKSFNKDFDTYCKNNYYYNMINPHQVTLKKWDPDLYFPFIQCPMLGVYGTNDERVEYSSSIDNIKRMLSENGNDAYKFLILEGYNHYLIKNYRRIDACIEDSVINNISDWIINLQQ